MTTFFHLVWVLGMLVLLTLVAGGGLAGLGYGLRATGYGERLTSAREPGHADAKSQADLRGPTARNLIRAWLPALLVLLLYVKNGVVFGVFTSSTWSSVAPSRTARASIAPQEIEQLIADLRVSRLMRQDIEVMNVERLRAPAIGVAVLDQKRRPSGKINWNYHGLLPMYAQLGHDARTVAWLYPLAWLRHAADSFCRYQAPATWSEYAVGQNRSKILAWSRLFEYAVWGAGLGRLLEELFGRLGWVTFVTLAAPLLLVDGVRLWLPMLVRDSAKRGERAVVAFLVANLVYVAVLTVGVADAEHERYHFFSDALLFVLACRAIHTWWPCRAR